MSRLGLALVLLAFASGRAAAQSQECSYTDCALRVQFGLLGGQTLIRAESGQRVRGVGFPVSGLDRAFEGSPVAQELARTYQSRTNVGTTLLLVGAAGLVVWLLDNSSAYGDVDYTWVWVALPFTTAGVAGPVGGEPGRPPALTSVEGRRGLSEQRLRSTGVPPTRTGGVIEDGDGGFVELGRLASRPPDAGDAHLTELRERADHEEHDPRHGRRPELDPVLDQKVEQVVRKEPLVGG